MTPHTKYPVRNYGDVFSRNRSSCRGEGFGVKADHEFGHVLAGKSPLERSGRLFITFLESEQSRLQFCQRVEIVGCENLTLNNGEVDLDLVEPTSVDGRVNRNDRRPAGLKTLDALLAAMGGAIIDDPKHASSRPIGFLTHPIRDQAMEGFDAILDYAAAADFGAANISSREVDPSSLSLVFVLDESRSSVEQAEGKDAYDDALGSQSSRRRRAQNLGGPEVVLARDLGRDRGEVRPFPQTRDHAERSSFDAAKDGWRLC